MCQLFLLICLLLLLHDPNKLDGDTSCTSPVIVCQMRKSCSIYIDVEIGLIALN